MALGSGHLPQLLAQVSSDAMQSKIQLAVADSLEAKHLSPMQDDAAMMKANPFECPLDQLSSGVEAAEGDQDVVAPRSLLAVDAALQEFASEHAWDDAGSLCDCRWALLTPLQASV